MPVDLNDRISVLVGILEVVIASLHLDRIVRVLSLNKQLVVDLLNNEGSCFIIGSFPCLLGHSDVELTGETNANSPIGENSVRKLTVAIIPHF